jgi:hypothetical protein
MRTLGFKTLAIVFLLLVSCTKEVPPIEFPVSIEHGSAEVVFSVTARGRYDVELEFSKDASRDLERDLHVLAGIATIASSDGKIVKRVNMPTHWLTYGRKETDATIIIRFYAVPNIEYRLSLQFSHVPYRLRSAPGTLKIEQAGTKKGGPDES